jgi:putative transcription factor
VYQLFRVADYGLSTGTEAPVKDQVHIRNAEAAHLARALARQTGRTISEIVLDALRQYRPLRQAPGGRRRIAHWQRLLREDRERGLARAERRIEDLYDEATGLPK